MTNISNSSNSSNPSNSSPNYDDVWLSVIADMEKRRQLGIELHGQHYGEILTQVIADMEKRRQLGIEIYGEPVKVGSFKSKLYLYEEILDSAAYLKTDILSGPSLDDYQSTVPADDCRFYLLILAQNLHASSDNLQGNLALALKYIAAIAKSHDIRLSQLSD